MIKLDFIFGITALVLCGWLMLRKMRTEAQKRTARTEGLFSSMLPLLSNVTSKPGDTAGTWIFSGNYKEAHFQLRSIIDTLATRKLPSLWLQVTLQRAQLVDQTIDVMRRPNGATTFSKFDFLSQTHPNPQNFPEDAVTRSDGETDLAIHDILSRHSALISISRAKELVVSPNGLRLVLQVAEGGRLRHGVFRQADFEEAHIDPLLTGKVMDGLLALDADLRANLKHG